MNISTFLFSLPGCSNFSFSTQNDIQPREPKSVEVPRSFFAVSLTFFKLEKIYFGHRQIHYDFGTTVVPTMTKQRHSVSKYHVIHT